MGMEKQERYAVYVYGRDSGGYTTKAFVIDFDYYPTDYDLEVAWVKGEEKFHKIFYLNVEKQVRFSK